MARAGWAARAQACRRLGGRSRRAPELRLRHRHGAHGRLVMREPRVVGTDQVQRVPIPSPARRNARDGACGRGGPLAATRLAPLESYQPNAVRSCGKAAQAAATYPTVAAMTRSVLPRRGVSLVPIGARDLSLAASHWQRRAIDLQGER